MTLFPVPKRKVKRPPRGASAWLRLPTGEPRLVESSRARRALVPEATWQALLEAIRRSATARLDLLKGCRGKDKLPCFWRRLGGCGSDCRCGGVGTISVEFLRDHYERLALEIEQLSQPRRAS